MIFNETKHFFRRAKHLSEHDQRHPMPRPRANLLLRGDRPGALWKGDPYWRVAETANQLGTLHGSSYQSIENVEASGKSIALAAVLAGRKSTPHLLLSISGIADDKVRRVH